MAITEIDAFGNLDQYFGGQAQDEPQIDEDPQLIIVPPTARETEKQRKEAFLKLREQEELYLNENPWLLQAAQTVGERLKQNVPYLKVVVTQSKAAGDERPVGININWGPPNQEGQTWIANRVFLPVSRDSFGGIEGIRVGKFVLTKHFTGTTSDVELFQTKVAGEVIKVEEARKRGEKVNAKAPAPANTPGGR